MTLLTTQKSEYQQFPYKISIPILSAKLIEKCLKNKKVKYKTNISNTEIEFILPDFKTLAAFFECNKQIFKIIE